MWRNLISYTSHVDYGYLCVRIMCYLDADDHGDTVAFYLIELSRENVVALGEALGLNANSLKEMQNMPSECVWVYVCERERKRGEDRERQS